MRRFQQYINGKFEDTSNIFESFDPATEEAWAEMPAASAQDVDRAVQAAHRCLYSDPWRSLNATARGKLLFKLADLVAKHAPDLAQLETKDTGKVIRETSAQIAYVAEYYRYFAGLADKVQGAHLPIDKPDMEVWLRREPIGVVAAIVPWNSQLFLSAVKLAPALAAGCTIVLKASEDGPAPLLEFARLIHEAGFPAGSVNVISGFGKDCGDSLTRHPLVSRIAFTGGPATARAVVRNSAENLAYTTLELGGKSPVIVFGDADLESASNAVVAGIFAAGGQSCVAGSRLLVQRDTKDRLIGILTEKAKRIVIGDPKKPETEVGPLATSRQIKHIEEVVAASIQAGAKLIVGGGRPANCPKGFFYSPTILDCAGVNSPSVEKELFGPVLSVLQFTDEAEAISIANDTPYGLAAGVFTKNISVAHRVAARLRTGMVWMNTYRAISPMVPFGGYGISGLAREGGLESVLDYTRVKSVWLRTSDDPIPDPFVMR